MPSAAQKNQAYWDQISDEYQAQHGPQLNARPCTWGTWAIPEDDLGVLDDVQGKDILELGCGAAQWSISLSSRGAKPVGLDISSRQLEHAKRLMQKAGVSFPLILASAETVPLRDHSFDVVFSDWGAMPFADPFRTIPEAARLLRTRGLLAFNMSTPIRDMCWNNDSGRVEDKLHADYFELRSIDNEKKVVYQLPYGEWIRLFRRNGFEIEDLIEIRPPKDATTRFEGWSIEWARSWPGEAIWKIVKAS